MGFKLPERLQAECVKIILDSGEDVFDQSLAVLAKIPGTPSDLAVKPARNNRRSMAEKVRIYLKSCPTVLENGDLLEILRTNSLYQEFTIVFSEPALAASYTVMAKFFGEPPVILALYLDPRPAVRELAIKHLEAYPAVNPWLNADLKLAAAEFADGFSLFISRLKQIVPAQAGSDAAVAIVKQPVPAVNDFEKIEKSLREKLTELKQKNEAAEKEVKNLAQENARLGKEHQALLKKIEAQAEIVSIKKIEETLAGVFTLENALSSVTLQDLNDPDKLFTLAEAEKCAPAIARIEKLLSAACVLRDALKTPSEAVKKAISELGEAKQRLDQAGKNIAAIQRLKYSFAELKAIAQRDGLSELLGQSVSSGRLLKKECDEINSVVEVLCERTGGHISLGQLIRKGEAFLLLVDGHNFMHFIFDKRPFAIKEKNADSQKSYIPHQAHENLKNRLIPEAFAALSQKSRACRIKLYFDSAGLRSEKKISENFSIIQSGGFGDQRADYSIINDVEDEFASFGIRKFISTNDKKLVEILKKSMPDIAVIVPDDLNRLLALNGCGDLTK